VLGSCDDGWCELIVGGRDGWVRAERLWGAGEP
jgi:SH3-like domain-containing protein